MKYIKQQILENLLESYGYSLDFLETKNQIQPIIKSNNSSNPNLLVMVLVHEPKNDDKLLLSSCSATRFHPSKQQKYFYKSKEAAVDFILDKLIDNEFDISEQLMAKEPYTTSILSNDVLSFKVCHGIPFSCLEELQIQLALRGY